MEIEERPGPGSTEGPAHPTPAPGASEPIGYLTTESLGAMWNARRQDVDRHRRAHPDDLKGIELRQRVASQLLQTFRLLADLEQQLGVVLGLPVLGAQRPDLSTGSLEKASPATAEVDLSTNRPPPG